MKKPVANVNHQEAKNPGVPVEATTMGPDTSISLIHDICMGTLVEGLGGDEFAEEATIARVNQKIHDFLIVLLTEGAEKGDVNMFHVCAAQARNLGEMVESVAEVIREKLGKRALN